MGNYFQTVVDIAASEAEVEVLAQRIRDWLVDRQIIEPDICDCVLDDTGMRYPPGSRYTEIVQEVDPLLGELRTNGLRIIKRRTVFHSGQGSLTISCSHCNSALDLREEWSEAVAEWYERRGHGVVRCPACGREEPITRWKYDPPWGFGELGFEFWNWPPLNPSFIQELSNRLGHKTVFVYGKL